MTQTCGCPENIPDWHQKDVDLSGQPSHTLKIASFFYMPLAYETYAQRQQRDIEQLEIPELWPNLVLTTTGMFRGYIKRILKPTESPSRFITHFNHSFMLHGLLHDGGIGTIKNSVRQLQNQLFDMGRMPKELYMCYLTCPICYDRKGGDKILLLRRWTESKTLANRLK